MENFLGSKLAQLISVLATSLFMQIVDVFQPLRWMFLFAIILVFADLRFGLKAARKRKEEIRASRAIRRTFNKITDILTWIILAGVLGRAFGEPLGLPIMPILVLIVVFGCEINSIFKNYFAYKGERLNINVLQYFYKKSEGVLTDTDNNHEPEK